MTKATPAAPTGVLTDTTGSYEMAVTIPAGHSYTDYEYKVGDGTYSPLPKLTDGKFTPAGTSAGTTHTVYIRLKADANHNASDAASATLTTPTLKKLTLDTQTGLKWTVTADAEGSVTMPSEPIRAGYTFQGWYDAKTSGTAYSNESPLTADKTVYAQWTPNNYSVAYHANAADASGSMENKSFVYGAEPAMLTKNGFARTGYTFCGWATSPAAAHVVYADEQAVSNLTSANGGVVDLYAVWVRSAFKVSGSVVEEIEGAAAPSAVSGVTVRLMRGDTQIGESAITDASGTYSFNGVPSGTYNIVATRTVENGEQTVTALVTVGGEDTTAAQVTLPAPNINSVLEVASDAPAVMVGGLNELAKDHAEADKDVTVTMTVEKKEETAEDSAVEEIKNSVERERTELDYLEIKVEKEVMQDGTKVTDESGTLAQTSRVMEIIVPFKTNHRSNFSVYRNHEGKAAGLNKLSARPETGFTDGTFFVDLANALVYIYANQFSTYAVGYEENYNVTVNGGSGSGDYAAGATVTITADAAPSGKVFDKWTTSDGVAFANASSSTTTFTMPAKDVTVIATYKASGSIGGGNGATYSPTVSDPDNGTVSISPTSPKTGDKVTITAKPDKGYEVDTVTVTDVSGKTVEVTKNADGTYSFTQPSGKVKIDVTFKEGSTTDALAVFSDVNASDWYAEAVRWALDNGVMNGVGNGKFNPNGDTSRAMIVTMLWRLEGSPTYAGASEFSDVDNEQWYGQAVRWANAEGIVKGDNGKFIPNGAVTREQLATMLYRYAQYKKADVSATASLGNYGDAQTVSSWATSAMQWAVGSGIINGIGSDLAPAGNATRAQVATMLMRYSTAK